MDIKEILPLSPLQKGLLFHMLLDTRGSDAYQVQQVYQLEGSWMSRGSGRPSGNCWRAIPISAPGLSMKRSTRRFS
ncbi:hypothetical protein BWI95_06475 [Kosakonia cowanii JCM 10956 = DSM 18146]|uniref:Uncharacterized protein n=2 Tax=Kosakonia cowanii TaxID=208223 RepID=A0A807LEP0_9ENTR|nr:hypothetical protein BWI95_06475 [Kosakonia cowanii JCM 10956 = DSM 18146]